MKKKIYFCNFVWPKLPVFWEVPNLILMNFNQRCSFFFFFFFGGGGGKNLRKEKNTQLLGGWLIFQEHMMSVNAFACDMNHSHFFLAWQLWHMSHSTSCVVVCITNNNEKIIQKNQFLIQARKMVKLLHMFVYNLISMLDVSLWLENL